MGTNVGVRGALSDTSRTVGDFNTAYPRLIHLDIIDGKIWIQRDGTEHGIATDLLEAGVPKEHIVLGFKSPEMRQYTEFAVA